MRKRIHGGSHGFYNLLLDLTSHYFYHSLFVRTELANPGHIQGMYDHKNTRSIQRPFQRLPTIGINNTNEGRLTGSVGRTCDF